MTAMSGSLSGRSIVITRPRRQNAALRRSLEDRGANVVEMPLIEIVEPDDQGHGRDVMLERLGDFDWVVVTSPNGAERVAPFLVTGGDVRVAVVGPATQEALGRVADLVSTRAIAISLIEDFPVGDGSVLVVQGDLADDTIATGIAAKGWVVSHVVAYRTIAVSPPIESRDRALEADALLLASGSAAMAWHDLIGDRTPGVVVAIGPSTARVARELGLPVTVVADSHSLEGMIAALETVFEPR